MSTNRPQNQNQFNWQAFSAPGYDGESSRTIRSDSTQQNTVRTAAQNAINRSRQPDFSRLDNHSNSSLSISSTVASSNSQRPQRSAPKSEPLAPKKNPITLPISEESDDDLAGSVPSWTMNFLPQRPATQPQPSDDTNYPPRNYSTTTARARPDSETGSNQRAFRMNPTTFTGREQAGREQIDENDFENLSMASSSTTSASRPQPQSQARPQPQSQSRPQENDLERLGTDLRMFLSNIETSGILENMALGSLPFEMKSLI